MKPYTLHLGDCHEFIKTLPDASADLIFTDPLYERIDDYVWLEQEAAKKLKPNGNILAFVNAKWLTRVLRALETELPVLSAVQNTSGGMNGKVIAKTYHLVWMGSGVIPNYVADGFIASPWSAAHSHNFKWTKNPKYIGHILAGFTNPGDLVVDPFAGGCSIAEITLQMGRRYWGSEIEGDTYQVGKKRLEAAYNQPRLLEAT